MPETGRQGDAKRPGGPLVLAYCWSHFGRRVFDIATAGNAPNTNDALTRIGELHSIEVDLLDSTAEERRDQRRQEHDFSSKRCSSGSTPN